MKTTVAAVLIAALLPAAHAAEITRYSNPPPSPIARACADHTSAFVLGCKPATKMRSISHSYRYKV